MRCEYPGMVAANCLCPKKDPPEGGAQICYNRVREKRRPKPNRWIYWGEDNYSDGEYCRKLNVIIDRPLGTVCFEHAHCAAGLQCSDGVCSTCPNDGCPDRTPSDKFSLWKNTCRYGEYECPNNDCARRGEGCSPTNLGLGCCTGLKCSPGRVCITNECKVDGECTEDDDDICQGYFCLENKVVNGVGRECYIEDNGVSSNCSISGTFCDVKSNTCYRSYDKPTPIRNLPYFQRCTGHFECDEGLCCNGGLCHVCQLAEEYPEKRKFNYPVCKHGEYNCPDVCLLENDQCRTTSGGPFGKTIKVGDCCHGMMCGVTGYCVNDERKTTGTCTDDNGCADKYGCLKGTVVYAEGHGCSSENNKASPNCTGGTICNTDTGICSWPTGKTRVTYNSWLYMPCDRNRDDDCDIDLYCSGMCQNCQNKAGGGCPEKAERNIRCCKFGDDKCLGNKCVTFGTTKVEGFSCCQGLKENNEGKCMTCKKSGACNNEDDGICDYYGCMDNKVVYAQQIECETVDDCPRNDYSAFNDKIICKSQMCIDLGYGRPAHYIEY